MSQAKSEAAAVAASRFDLKTIKEGIRRLLPVLRTIAAVTPTPADDALVAFLSELLKDETKMAAAYAAVR